MNNKMRILSAVLAASILFIPGCSSTDSGSQTTTTATTAAQATTTAAATTTAKATTAATTKATTAATTAAAKVRDFPEGDYEEMGEGTVYIATAGGTSEDGNIPVIYEKKDTSIKQIGFDAWDFNGKALSFIYIDGMLHDKMQLANTQTTLTLSADQLAAGKHSIEVVQYENDDPESDMITYKSMAYEIKLS